ncbi:MAG: RluA family pseudouridine synthase [Granulosicoccaceae bacterium]
MLEISFEDDFLLVVNKPAGVLSQPGKTMDGSIATQVAHAYPDATGPLLVHRLDMDTSGLLLLAKRRDIHRQLQQLFEKRRVAKRYIALLTSKPIGLGGLVTLPIRSDIDNRPSQIVCHEHGKAAATLWRLMPEGASFTRVLFQPVTGRTHQLRVHSAAAQGLNSPIVGDRLYGAAAERLMLHAQCLEFEHPITKAMLRITAEAPF